MKLADEFRQQRLHTVKQLEDGETANQERRNDAREARRAAAKFFCGHRQEGNQTRASNALGPTPIEETRIGRK